MQLCVFWMFFANNVIEVELGMCECLVWVRASGSVCTVRTQICGDVNARVLFV